MSLTGRSASSTVCIEFALIDDQATQKQGENEKGDTESNPDMLILGQAVVH